MSGHERPLNGADSEPRWSGWPEQEYYIGLSERINRARHQRGMTQLELAVELDVDAVAVSYWERGFRRPSIYMVRRLEQALRVSLL